MGIETAVEPVGTQRVGAKRRLLLIESEELISRELAEALDREDLAVDIAPSVGKAIELLGCFGYDAVVSEIWMPQDATVPSSAICDKDSREAGTGVMERIRKGDFSRLSKNTPLFVTTLVADLNAMRKVKNLGVQWVEYKPYNSRQVACFIKNFLSPGKDGHTNQPQPPLN